jgi:hypothetical protein
MIMVCSASGTVRGFLYGVFWLGVYRVVGPCVGRGKSRRLYDYNLSIEIN